MGYIAGVSCNRMHLPFEPDWCLKAVEKVIMCTSNSAAVFTLFALIITCKPPGSILTIPFRSPIHHRCSTFPIQQETAVRDVSHPVAGDALQWTKEQSQGTIQEAWLDKTAVRLRAFSSQVWACGQGFEVWGGWSKGKEREQDVVDSAITHRMLGEVSLTKYREGQEASWNVSTKRQAGLISWKENAGTH